MLGDLLDQRLVEGGQSAWIVRQQRQDAAVAARTPAANPRFDEAKHKRGAKGTSQGGKFVSSGSSGAPVEGVQRKLGTRVTGSFDFNTRAAVMSFQRSKGLTVDGVVGRQTAAALRGDRNAASVKTGALSATDLKSLSAHGGRARNARRRLHGHGAKPMRVGGGLVV